MPPHPGAVKKGNSSVAASGTKGSPGAAKPTAAPVTSVAQPSRKAEPKNGQPKQQQQPKPGSNTKPATMVPAKVGKGGQSGQSPPDPGKGKGKGKGKGLNTNNTNYNNNNNNSNSKGQKQNNPQAVVAGGGAKGKRSDAARAAPSPAQAKPGNAAGGKGKGKLSAGVAPSGGAATNGGGRGGIPSSTSKRPLASGSPAAPSIAIKPGKSTPQARSLQPSKLQLSRPGGVEVDPKSTVASVAATHERPRPQRMDPRHARGKERMRVVNGKRAAAAFKHEIGASQLQGHFTLAAEDCAVLRPENPHDILAFALRFFSDPFHRLATRRGLGDQGMIRALFGGGGFNNNNEAGAAKAASANDGDKAAAATASAATTTVAAASSSSSTPSPSSTPAGRKRRVRVERHVMLQRGPMDIPSVDAEMRMRYERVQAVVAVDGYGLSQIASTHGAYHALAVSFKLKQIMHAVVDSLKAEDNAILVTTEGTRSWFVFASPVAAIRAGAQMIDLTQEWNASPQVRNNPSLHLEFDIGMDYGRAMVVPSSGVYGEAARVAGFLGDGFDPDAGEFLVSKRFFDQLRHSDVMIGRPKRRDVVTGPPKLRTHQEEVAYQRETAAREEMYAFFDRFQYDHNAALVDPSDPISCVDYVCVTLAPAAAPMDTSVYPGKSLVVHRSDRLGDLGNSCLSQLNPGTDVQRVCAAIHATFAVERAVLAFVITRGGGGGGGQGGADGNPHNLGGGSHKGNAALLRRHGLRSQQGLTAYLGRLAIARRRLAEIVICSGGTLLAMDGPTVTAAFTDPVSAVGCALLAARHFEDAPGFGSGWSDRLSGCVASAVACGPFVAEENGRVGGVQEGGEPLFSCHGPAFDLAVELATDHTEPGRVTLDTATGPVIAGSGAFWTRSRMVALRSGLRSEAHDVVGVAEGSNGQVGGMLAAAARGKALHVQKPQPQPQPQTRHQQQQRNNQPLVGSRSSGLSSNAHSGTKNSIDEVDEDDGDDDGNGIGAPKAKSRTTSDETEQVKEDVDDDDEDEEQGEEEEEEEGYSEADVQDSKTQDQNREAEADEDEDEYEYEYESD